MSFEMKYDKNGVPVSQVANFNQPEQELSVEVVTQDNELVEDVESQEVIEEESQPEPVQQAAESNKDRNFRLLREKADRSDRFERERDAAIQELQASKNKQPEVDYDEELGLNETDLAEGKHLSKVDKKIRKLQQELNTYKQQTAAQVTQARIKSQFPDFEKIVNPGNIQILESQFPEIAYTLNSSTDLYSTAVSAYTMIKKLGISKEEVYNPDRAQAIRNLSKPKPLASVSPQQGESPLSKANAFANGLTDDLKDQLRREMFEARNKM
jgi:TPP-dependent indolepyruvate ferredoxin oxidoreductase alpha subunit